MSHNSSSSRNATLLTVFTNTHSRSPPSISSLSDTFLSVIPKRTATSQLHNPSHPVKNANRQASHYTIFSISLSLPPPCSRSTLPSVSPCSEWPGERLARGWTVRGSNRGGSHSTCARPDPSWGPTSGSLPGSKCPERGVNHSLPPCAEVKERVELYFTPPRSLYGMSQDELATLCQNVTDKTASLYTRTDFL